LSAVNTNPGAGIAGYVESNGTDATLVVKNDGTGVIMKGFGSNGGEEEFRIAHNGTVRIYDAAHSNVIALDASNGRGTFRDLRLTGHAEATLPVAYAFVNGTTGEVTSGTSNVACKWEPANERYAITITGEGYFYNEYQTVVTPATHLPALATTTSFGGQLIIYLYDLAGNKVKRDFQFVTFKVE
jgi:hypothetical protein